MKNARGRFEAIVVGLQLTTAAQESNETEERRWRTKPYAFDGVSPFEPYAFAGNEAAELES